MTLATTSFDITYVWENLKFMHHGTLELLHRFAIIGTIIENDDTDYFAEFRLCLHLTDTELCHH